MSCQAMNFRGITIELSGSRRGCI